MINPVLFEVTAAWTDLNVRYWLFGGHAVELLVQEDTRAHDDIDFFVAAEDAKGALSVLEGLGFSACHGSLEAGDVFYRRTHTVLDIVPIQDGTLPKTYGELADILWPEGFLTPYLLRHPKGTVRTLTAEMHLHMKTIIKDFYGFTEPREKDLIDLEHLHRFVTAGRV